jgi:hypothetical protein
LGIPPSEAEFVVEFGYIKCKEGNIYKNYSLMDPKGGWKYEWLVVKKIEEYYSCDSDITTCSIPDNIPAKSIIIRCRTT